MKAFIIRILSILFLFSFCTIFLWHYTTQSNEVRSVRHSVKKKPVNSKIAASVEPLKVNQNPAESNGKDIIVKKKRARNKTAAAVDTLKVNQNPAESDNEIPSAQFNAKKKSLKIKGKNAAAVDPLKVNQNPADSDDASNLQVNQAINNNEVPSVQFSAKKKRGKSKNAAAVDPLKVNQNPAESNDEISSVQLNAKKKPAKSKNAAAVDPLKVNQNPADSDNAVRSVQFKSEKKPAMNNDAAVVELKVLQNPAESEDAAAIDPQEVNQNPAESDNLNNPKEKNPNKHRVVRIHRRIVNKKIVKNKDDVLLDPRDFMRNLDNFNDEFPMEEIKNFENDPEAIERENKVIDELLEKYNSKWERHAKSVYNYRSYLSRTCNAISEAVATQDNAPVGTMFTYDGDNKKKMEVTPNLFKLFPKENPFKDAPWDTCAVVGNGGILANSSCGNEIDSATYVIRCNLPPLNNGYDKDTGQKTNLVTANPSILVTDYQALNEYRRAFVEEMKMYGDAHILLPAFSFPRNTGVSLRALYALGDYNPDGPKAIFYNPVYMNSVTEFWRDQGMRSLRLSTGIMMATLAMELCHTVHLYGFWPFGLHPHTRQPLTNHYYDDLPVNKRVHEMPAEFESLLNLHNKGVIHLHLGECKK